MAERAFIPIDGILELAPLGAILNAAGNASVGLNTLYWDFTTETLMHGPAGSRTAVTVTGTPVTWLNFYGDGFNSTPDETTAEAPPEWGQPENKYGDTTEVTKIVHSFSFSGYYKAGELFWKSLRTTKDAFGNERMYYSRFFPKGKLAASEVWHGVVENRAVGVDFTRSDYTPLSIDFPYKTRQYITDLPTPYPPI